MSRSIDKCIDDIVTSFDDNIVIQGEDAHLSNMGKAQLRSALTQLVFEIKEEIRNETHQ